MKWHGRHNNTQVRRVKRDILFFSHHAFRVKTSVRHNAIWFMIVTFFTQESLQTISAESPQAGLPVQWLDKLYSDLENGNEILL